MGTLGKLICSQGYPDVQAIKHLGQHHNFKAKFTEMTKKIGEVVIFITNRF